MKLKGINVNYIFGKFRSKVIIHLFKTNKVMPNFFLINATRQSFTKVLFYFPEATFMHLGDHLFFEPICRLLQDNGIDVYVQPAPGMVRYFEYCGYKRPDEELSKYDLIITKQDFIYQLRNEKNILLIETAYPKINKPLIEDMMAKFSEYLNLQHTVSSKPLYYHVEDDGFQQKFQLKPEKKYIVYNNYLLSGAFRVKKSKFARLDEFVIRFKEQHPDYEVIHTGTAADKQRDTVNRKFVDIDFRGKTSVYELFALCAQPNVVHYAGFDGFIMHLFFMLEKKAFVMSRGRWSEESRLFLETYIDPPFTPSKPVSEIKTYIS